MQTAVKLVGATVARSLDAAMLFLSDGQKHLFGRTTLERTRQKACVLGIKADNASSLTCNVCGILMTLAGNNSSLSIMIQHNSSIRGSKHAYLRDRARSRCDGKRNQTYAMVVQVELLSTNRKKSRTSKPQDDDAEASSFSISNKKRCWVCLENDHMRDSCLFAANTKKLTAVRK